MVNMIPWRIRLGFRKALSSSVYAKYYNRSESYLRELGIQDVEPHLIERAIQGVGFSMFNARCIEARTVPGTWEQVIRLLPRTGLKSIADIGCGKENPGRILEKLGLKVAYSDIEAFTHIDNFRQMNFNQGIGYGDREFDYAVSVDVIEHLENTRQFCRELKRISRSGFIVATPNPLSRRSIRLLERTGYFEWFARNEVSWHINPVFHFQMSTIADELAMKLEISGNTCFFKQHDPIEHAEALIYRFANG